MRTHKCVYTYTPTLGVKTDFETLLQRFTQTSTVRYEKFAEIWREMKMSQYCAGRNTHRECREFVEECFKLAMQYWLPPSAFQVRAGALYLLYGLYYFQLVSPKVKIRVTYEQWQKVTEFQDQAREQQHLDVDYVFQKMKIDAVFMFVAKNEEIFPKMKDASGLAVPDTMKDDDNHIDEVFTSQVLNQLAVVHDQYYKMKVALVGPDSTEPDNSLDIIHRDMIHSIYKTVRIHKEKQAGQYIPVGRKKPDDPDYIPGEETSRKFKSMSLKHSLKKKAFGQLKRGKQSAGSSSDQAMSDKASDSDAAVLMSPPRKMLMFKRGRKKLGDLYSNEDMDVNLPDSFSASSILSMPPMNIIKPVLIRENTDRESSKRKKGVEMETATDTDEFDSVESSDEDSLAQDCVVKKGRKKSSDGVKKIVKDDDDNKDRMKGIKNRKGGKSDNIGEERGTEIGKVKEKMKKTTKGGKSDIEEQGTEIGKGNKKKPKGQTSVDSLEISENDTGEGKRKKKKQNKSASSENISKDQNQEEPVKKEKAGQSKKKTTNDVILEVNLNQHEKNDKVKRKRSEDDVEEVLNDNEEGSTVNPTVKGKSNNLKRKQAGVTSIVTNKESGISTKKKRKSVVTVIDGEQGMTGKEAESGDDVVYTEMVCTPTMKEIKTGNNEMAVKDEKVKVGGKVAYTTKMKSSETDTDEGKCMKGKKSAGNITYTEIVCTPTMKSSGTATDNEKGTKGRKSAGNVTYTEIICTPKTMSSGTGTDIENSGKGKQLKSRHNVTYTEIICTPKMESTDSDISAPKGKKMKPTERATDTGNTKKRGRPVNTTKSDISAVKDKTMKPTERAADTVNTKKRGRPAKTTQSLATANVGSASGDDLPASKTAQEKLMDKINKRKKEARKVKK